MVRSLQERSNQEVAYDGASEAAYLEALQALLLVRRAGRHRRRLLFERRMIVLWVLGGWLIAALLAAWGWSRWFRYQRAADRRDRAG